MKSQAIALQKPAMLQAYESLINSAELLVNLLYGTQQRANVTMLSAFGFAVAGMFLLQTPEVQNMLSVCVK